MVALSIALAYVATLGFVVLLLQRQWAKDELRERIKRLEVRASAIESDVTFRSGQAARDIARHAEQVGQICDGLLRVDKDATALAERLGKVEMALQVKRISLG